MKTTLKACLLRILAPAGAAGLFTALSAGAAPDDFSVLPPQLAGGAPALMMETYLKKQAFAALDQRDAAFEKLQNREQLLAWQQDRRETHVRRREYLQCAAKALSGSSRANPGHHV